MFSKSLALTLLSFSLSGNLNSLAQNRALLSTPHNGHPEKRSDQYFCPPCGCTNDGVPAHERVRCPACRMRLVKRGNYTNARPAVSADGSKIIFESSRDGNLEIYSMAVDGSNQLRLTKHDSIDEHPSWSPDGSTFVFTSFRSGNADVFTMKAYGAGQAQLTKTIEWDGLPAFSPDGKRILFASRRDGNGEIYVMNADGSHQVNLTRNPDSDNLPAWSRDGRTIFFASARDGSRQLFSMDSNGSNQQVLNAQIRNGAVSPDGTSIAFDKREENGYNIYVAYLDRKGEVRLTAGEDVYNRHPFWSPDGSKIYYDSDRDGQSEIYVMNSTGENQKRLTFQPAEH